MKWEFAESFLFLPDALKLKEKLVEKGYRVKIKEFEDRFEVWYSKD